MSALRGACSMRGVTTMRAIIAVAIALAACGDRLPSRPDETKFRAASEGERCRLTASRAIMCMDDLMVAELRSIDGVGAHDPFVEEIDRQLADDKRLPKDERKQNIEVHKVKCAADAAYPDAVFRCWATTGCKEFAACVHTPQPVGSAGSPAAAGSATPAGSSSPTGSATPVPAAP